MDMIQFAIDMGAPKEYFDEIKSEASELYDEAWADKSDYYKLVGLWQWGRINETTKFKDAEKEKSLGQIYRDKSTKIKYWAAKAALQCFDEMNLQGETLWARIAEDNWLGISLCDMCNAVSQGYAEGAYGEIDDEKASTYEKKAQSFSDEAIADVYFEGKLAPKDYWMALIFYTRSEIGVPDEESRPERHKRMAKCYFALGDHDMFETYTDWATDEE